MPFRPTTSPAPVAAAAMQSVGLSTDFVTVRDYSSVTVLSVTLSEGVRVLTVGK